MRKKSFIYSYYLISQFPIQTKCSDWRRLLEKANLETGFIHAPLPLDTSVLSKKALKKEVLPANRLQKQTVQTDGPIPEHAVWLSLMRNPYPAKVAFV